MLKSEPSLWSLTPRNEPGPSPYTCPDCGEEHEWTVLGPVGSNLLHKRTQCACDIRQEEARQSEYRKALTLDTYRGASGMTSLMLACTLADLEDKPLTETKIKRSITIKEAVAKAYRYIAEFPASGSLVLSGPVGTGKTHIACAIANALIERFYLVRLVNLPDLFAEAKALIGYKGDEVPCDPIPKLLASDLLILDELAECSEYDRKTLYRIINRRYEANAGIIVTTNLRTLDELKAQVGDRCMDRLLHKSQWIDVDAPSHRIGEFKETHRRANQ